MAPVGGKRQQSSRGGFPTRDAAYRAGVAAYQEYQNSGKVFKVDESVSVADYFALWEQHYVASECEKTTAATYRALIKNHILPFFGTYRLAAVDRPALQEFINVKIKERSESTVKILRTILREAFDYAVTDLQILKHNPADRLRISKQEVQRKKAVKKERADDHIKALSLDEVQTVLNKLEGMSHHAAFLAFHTGMRAGEILALSWDDVNFDSGTLHIHRTLQTVGGSRYISPYPKSDKSIRIISVGPSVVRYLREMKKSQREAELLSGSGYWCCYTDSSFQLHMLQKSEVPPDGLRRRDFVMTQPTGKHYSAAALWSACYRKFSNEFKFHNLRHTHATMLIEAGISPKVVQERLGHENVAFTLNRYVTATRKMDSSAAAVFESLL